MKAVVGLGNPGVRYAGTRHNIGFRVVDFLGEKMIWEDAGAYHIAECEHPRVLLVKPMTYMNRSGHAVGEVLGRFDLALGDVLMVVDDVHLDVGRLRFRRGGSPGGHNGLRSIAEALGSSDFSRLRVGVGQPPTPDVLVDYVLESFSPEEQPLIAQVIQQAADGVVCWALDGMTEAMNRFNAVKGER